MCKTLMLFIISLMPFSAKAQAPVGDVKYSVLPPEKFELLNPGWVLMDGRSINRTKLASLWDNNDKLPDARGLFIRGMNKGREHSTGDEDGDKRTSAGQEQPDQVGPHVHTLKLNRNSVLNFGDGARPPVTPDTPAPGYNHETKESEQTVSMSTNLETRPRNIALYVYIKIN